MCRNDNGNTHFLYASRKREKRTRKKRNEVTWGEHLSGHTPHLQNLTLSQKSRLFLSESLSEGKAKHSTQNLTKCQEKHPVFLVSCHTYAVADCWHNIQSIRSVACASRPRNDEIDKTARKFATVLAILPIDPFVTHSLSKFTAQQLGNCSYLPS